MCFAIPGRYCIKKVRDHNKNNAEKDVMQYNSAPILIDDIQGLKTWKDIPQKVYINTQPTKIPNCVLLAKQKR